MYEKPDSKSFKIKNIYLQRHLNFSFTSNK